MMKILVVEHNILNVSLPSCSFYHKKFFFEPKMDSVVEIRMTDNLKGSMAMFVVKSF